MAEELEIHMDMEHADVKIRSRFHSRPKISNFMGSQIWIRQVSVGLWLTKFIVRIRSYTQLK